MNLDFSVKSTQVNAIRRQMKEARILLRYTRFLGDFRSESTFLKSLIILLKVRAGALTLETDDMSPQS